MDQEQNDREAPAESNPPAPLEFFDKNQLRRAVSLAAVAATLGIVVDEQGMANCPFHADEHPSFEIFEDPSGVERWSCYPCGKRGDVYDLLRESTGCTFPEALERVRGLQGLVPPPPKREARRPFHRDECLGLVTLANVRARSPGAPGWMCVFAGLLEPTDDEARRVAADAHLREHWRWGVGGDGELMFPHYDAIGDLTGAKYRAVDGIKWSFPGSHYYALYGSWRERRFRDVVICEGETDCAWASLSSPAADVLGMPSGAGRREDAWAALDADVYWLALDADDQGREATAWWQTALAGRDVRVLDIPEGSDLKESRLDVAAIVGRA